jgi:hypothetical protein
MRSPEMQQGAKTDYSEKSEEESSTSPWIVLFAALWLDVVVIIYVALQLIRVATPVQEWFPKIIELFGL